MSRRYSRIHGRRRCSSIVRVLIWMFTHDWWSGSVWTGGPERLSGLGWGRIYRRSRLESTGFL